MAANEQGVPKHEGVCVRERDVRRLSAQRAPR